MGCASTKHRPMEQPIMYTGGYMQQQQPMMYSPEPVMSPVVGNGYMASEAFLADWSRFLHGQTPPQFDQTARVDAQVFPVHEAGRDWAEQTLQRMHQDLEGMGIGGDYNYDQNGDDKSGEILIECKTSNHGGPVISKNMRWRLCYNIPYEQPQMMMQQPQMMMQQPQMMMQQPQMMMQQPQMMMQQPQMMMQQPQMGYG